MKYILYNKDYIINKVFFKHKNHKLLNNLLIKNTTDEIFFTSTKLKGTFLVDFILF